MTGEDNKYTYRKISEDEFFEKYKPVKNHLSDDHGFDGDLYETYGEELEFVRKQPTNTIWTLIEGDGRMCITNGYHLVNRLGYFITKKQWEDNVHIEVSLEEYPACSECGGTNIEFEALVLWNSDIYDFKVESLMDQGHHCVNCDGECSIEWK